MRVALGVWAVAFGLTAGCHPAPRAQPVQARPATPTVGPAAPELSLARAGRIAVDLKALPQTPARQEPAERPRTLTLTVPACQMLAAKHAHLANTLDDETRVPPTCETAEDRLRQTVRYHAALELRNRAAADGLERFFQLAEAEAAADLTGQSFEPLETLLAKANAARAAGVQFPLDPADLERQRHQARSRLERAESTRELLNIDLRRRVGLAPQSADLWPSFATIIEPAPVDAEVAANAALADRPELRGLRAVHAGLTVDTLPTAREILRAANPLLGGAPPPVTARLMLGRRKPDPAAVAEVEVRRKQLAELIASREREIADEARAAAAALNAQTRQVLLARDRLESWTATRADAAKKRAANQPGAELLEAQATLDWLKAKAEATNELLLWHQTRVRLKAAQGWLAWETLGELKK